jgi:peptidoglycan-associated lipoprotein
MVRKDFGILVAILCLGLILIGCPKKTAVKEEPSVKKGEAGSERVVDRTKVMTPKEEKGAEGFEKSLVAKREPGIEGEVFESKLLKDIHFDFDKYNIRPEDAEILKENAVLLKRYARVKVQIEGHCDERGTTEYNLALGERRANSAKRYLVSLGISPDRISTISYGKERPLDPGHNEEAWAKNRRDHTIISSK